MPTLLTIESFIKVALSVVLKLFGTAGRIYDVQGLSPEKKSPVIKRELSELSIVTTASFLLEMLQNKLTNLTKFAHVVSHVDALRESRMGRVAALAFDFAPQFLAYGLAVVGSRLLFPVQDVFKQTTGAEPEHHKVVTPQPLGFRIMKALYPSNMSGMMVVQSKEPSLAFSANRYNPSRTFTPTQFSPALRFNNSSYRPHPLRIF